MSTGKFREASDVELVTYAVTMLLARAHTLSQRLLTLESLLIEKGILEEGELARSLADLRGIMDIEHLLGTGEPILELRELCDEFERRFFPRRGQAEETKE